MPEPEAEAVLRFLDDAAAGDSPATASVSRILGRRPRDFEAWALKHVADLRPAGRPPPSRW
jgi:hypothetical protein